MEGTDVRTQGKVDWLSVVVFYVIACAISWPFFWKRDILGEQVPTYAYMCGPGIAAIITMLLFRKRHPRTITIFGNSTGKSLLFYFLPSVALSVVMALSPGEESGAFGLSFSTIIFLPLFGLLNTLGEELGWRGFLQDALRPLRPAWRYVLIGVLWEFWHFTNRTAGRPLGKVAVILAVSYVAAILLSWIIGSATDRTKSVMVAVTLHAWVNILFEFPGTGTFIVFALSLVLWIYLLKRWDSREPSDTMRDGGQVAGSDSVVAPLIDGRSEDDVAAA